MRESVLRSTYGGTRTVSQDYADPDCPTCRGSGWIYAKSMLTLPGERGGYYCKCAQDHLRLQNMERMWRSLAAASMPAALREDPPLKPLTKHNVWITAKEPELKAHLKALAFNMSSMWDARVYSDKDLVKAWLGTAYAQGHKILDTEINDAMVTVKAMYIDELVEPHELVILLLGVKQAPNKETPNVLLEAVRTRMHLGRPLWIIDQPDAPIDNEFHRGYSEQLEGILAHWPHLRIVGPNLRKVTEGTVSVPSTVANTPQVVEELIEARASSEQAKIDEALEDLDEDTPPKRKRRSPPKEDDADDVEVEEEEEEEDDEDENEETKVNFLDELEQNEEEQESKPKGRSKFKPSMRGGRRR